VAAVLLVPKSLKKKSQKRGVGRNRGGSEGTGKTEAAKLQGKGIGPKQVHAGTVDGAALCRMFNRAIRWQLKMPKYLSTDNDPFVSIPSVAG
jgi:hypothetical protein